MERIERLQRESGFNKIKTHCLVSPHLNIKELFSFKILEGSLIQQISQSIVNNLLQIVRVQFVTVGLITKFYFDY